MAQISQERLNEIANRRLTKLGIAATLGADGPLVGTIAFPALRHPASGTALGAARFVVVSHDQLQFLDAPLASLPPVPFYDVATVALLQERVQGALDQRLAAIRVVVVRLQKFKLVPQLDADRLVGQATVSASSTQFLLEAHPEGVRIARVRLAAGKELALGEGPLLDLDAHDKAIDLELFLSAMVPALLERAQGEAQAVSPQQATAPKAGGPAPGAFEAVAVAGTLPSLAWLLEKFGALAAAKAELALDFKDGADSYRLLAAHVEGSVFRVSVYRHAEPTRAFWQESVDFARVARTSDLLATVLGRAVAVAAPQPRSAERSAATAAAERSARTAIPDHLAPHVEEVWVMHALVERDDDNETRYVSTDADGRPYGAARVLPRDVFRSVFIEHRGSWRLCIRIEEIQGDQVVYVQLDANRQPSSAPRTIAMANLVATFVPEASQY